MCLFQKILGFSYFDKIDVYNLLSLIKILKIIKNKKILNY